MKSRIFCFYRVFTTFFVLNCLAGCQEKVPQPQTVQMVVDQVVYPYIATGATVGVMVGVRKDGQSSLYSYGEKELGNREKPDLQTIFEIASITKTFTGLALADMHLKGEINLDEPVEKYLPAQVKVPSRNGIKITLRHLANHTSGLPGSPTNSDKKAYNPHKGYTQEKFYQFLNSYTLSRDPGTQYEYSGVGYGLLGYVLGLKDNTDYEGMIKSRVLKPLGLNHTFVTPPADQLQHVAQGHYGRQKVESWSRYMDPVMQGTGALSASTEDMLLYLEAVMGESNTPLQAAIALTQELKPLTFSALHWKADGIGLGWEFFTLDGKQITCKNGGNGAFNSFIGFHKSSRTGVVILINSSLHPDAFQTQIGFELLIRLASL